MNDPADVVCGYRWELVDIHFGPNAWMSDGSFIAAVYPNKVYRADCGDPRKAVEVFSLPEGVPDIRALFVTKDDTILVSASGTDGPNLYGTFRSTDRGDSFQQVLGARLWGIDQDSAGSVYGGTYETAPNGCRLMKSVNDGLDWVDVSPAAWSDQTHVHNIAIRPDNGWLYANLGDVDGLDGCWRSKASHCVAASPVLPGHRRIDLSTPLDAKEGDTLILHTRTASERHVILRVFADRLTTVEPIRLAGTKEDPIHVMVDDWVNKVTNSEASLQYCSLHIEGDRLILADDNKPGKHDMHVALFEAYDDGSPDRVDPDILLGLERPASWGVFYYEAAANGVHWLSIRPTNGVGMIWVGANGRDWQSIGPIVEQEKRPYWLESHSLRDGTRGGVGDGRSMMNDPRFGPVIPLGEGALLFVRDGVAQGAS